MAFLPVNKRLLLRYDKSPTYSLSHVAINASDEAMYKLGEAIGLIQEDTPEKICVVDISNFLLAPTP